MISSLRIRNFKLWKDTGMIRMAPLTLFFGANSSGKSSIGQFLMMLKQTIASPDRKAVFYPGGKTSAVQLGSYQEMVFHHNSANKIRFEYGWDTQEIVKFRDPISGQSFSGDKLYFEAEVGLGAKDQHALVVDRLNYQLIRNNELTISIGMERKSGAKAEYKVDADRYVLKRKQGRVWYPGAPVRFYGFPDEVVAYHQNADFVQTLNLEHEKLFSMLGYLGPLRTKAERLYSWTGIEPESVGYAGENTVAAILAARNRKIALVKPNAKRASPAKPFEEIIALKLKEMGLIEGFKVNPISDQRQEYEVKIRINSREQGADRNIQLVIETHSEHFLRRLQRRIAEDVVPQEKVSAYFADITQTPATLDPLQIDLFGNILNWPDNFFGDEMGDITEHAKAAMKKRMRQAEMIEEGS